MYQDDDLVAIGVASTILGVSRNTVRRYEEQGLLASVRTPGNHKRFRVGDLRALLVRAA